MLILTNSTTQVAFHLTGPKMEEEEEEEGRRRRRTKK
jgi:hypothetical protein